MQGPWQSPGIAELEHGFQMLGVYKTRLHLAMNHPKAAEQAFSSLDIGSEEVVTPFCFGPDWPFLGILKAIYYL